MSHRGMISFHMVSVTFLLVEQGTLRSVVPCVSLRAFVQAAIVVGVGP